MCYKFSYDVLIISLGIVTFTVGLVYMNNLLDFDSDMESGKKSICCRIGKINSAINVLLAIFCFGYLNFICYAFIKMNFLYLLPLLTLPLAIEIWKSAKLYYQDKFAKTEIKWWYYPLENWNKIRETKTAGFYLRLFMTRNLMIWVSFLFIFSLLLDY